MRATGLEKSILLNRFKRKIVCISVEIHKFCSVKNTKCFLVGKRLTLVFMYLHYHASYLLLITICKYPPPKNKLLPLKTDRVDVF